jgi:hypothetical protein
MAKKVDALTVERLREVLDYNPETGIFIWKIATHGHFAGGIAGTLTHGYVAIRIDGIKHSAHRLAWLHSHGSWPPCLIDHKNLNRSDNRLENLRLATNSSNKANRFMPANNSTGFKGVSFSKSMKLWQASICRNYKQMHLGFFESAEEAHAAYSEAAKRLFGEFARV